MDFTRIRIMRMFCLYIITCKNFTLTVWLGESFIFYWCFTFLDRNAWGILVRTQKWIFNFIVE